MPEASQEGLDEAPVHVGKQSRWRVDSASRWWLGAAGLAALLAGYVGFRLPSRYALTLFNIDLGDGAWRRGTLGTLTYPLWAATGHRYEVMALFAFSALIAILAIALIFLVKARSDIQRLVVLAWLVTPTGAYFFHEVGYFDQFVYLLFFLAALLLVRGSTLAAALVMSFSVLVHEISLVTTLPLLILVFVLRNLPLKETRWFGLPMAVGVVLLFAPRIQPEKVDKIYGELESTLSFTPRLDAIQLFSRSLGETWQLDVFSPLQGLQSVLPMLVLVFVASVAMVAHVSFEGAERRDSRRQMIVGGMAVVASVAPFLLVFLGWDFFRWVFLGVTNFTIVTFVLLSRTESKYPVRLAAIVLIPFAGFFYFPLQYFDGFAPRPVSIEIVMSSLTNEAGGMLSPPQDSVPD